MINVYIDIKCKDRDEAAALVENIADAIEAGVFSASCNKDTKEKYGGTVFVTECSE